jgi:hypothetical protein
MHYFRKAVPWIVFIVLAFAIPASAVRMREGRSSHCQHGCFYLTPAASKWLNLALTVVGDRLLSSSASIQCPQDRHGVDRNSISCEVIANTKPALQREAGLRPRSVAFKGIAAIGL